MPSRSTLKKYKERRDFTQTPEPLGKVTKQRHKKPIFVIQKHNASRLHYDFRIEMDGVLASWAIPKGPSRDPREKRLAVLTEDHPMSYATFEGIIPFGHYGAGEVIVWDNGTFENIRKKDGVLVSLRDSFKEGHIEIWLTGKKLQGGFAFIRMSPIKNWLCVKMDDEYAHKKDSLLNTRQESVISGRTLEDILGGKEHRSNLELYQHKKTDLKKVQKNRENKKKSVKKVDTQTVHTGRKIIEISNWNKVLFGASGITKGDLVTYYKDIAPIMLSYVKGRLIAMQRFPDGIHSEGFFQKDAGSHFPSWITKVPVKKRTGDVTEYVIINNAASLVYLAGQACITPHIWLSRNDRRDIPDRLIFDIDPPDEHSFKEVQWVAEQIKDFLELLGLPVYFMLTGSRGAHVVVPLKRVHTFDETRAFAYDIVTILADYFPERITVELQKTNRKNRIFLDWLRNSSVATAVAPYSVRAKEGAPVAVPVTWQELSRPGMKSQKYTIKNVFKRLDSIGDIWSDMQSHAVSLTKAIKKLEKIKRSLSDKEK